MVTVSAPGKIHVLGEHAVVYGKPALLAAINLRLSVSVEEGKKSLTINAPEGHSYIQHAVETTVKELRLSNTPPLNITVRSDIPVGYHLGSSAAVAVATVGAVMYYMKKLWNPERINQIAYEVEKLQHGNPSGGDNTTATFGGFIWFRKELEFLKSIWKFPFSFPDTLNHFFLIHTGRPKETTGEMVSWVKKKKEENEEKFISILLENETQTKRAAQAIRDGDENLLIDAIRQGERTLEAMGAVSESAISLIRAIEDKGGAAKILGGGGRTGPVGCILCYHHDPTMILSLCHPFGYTIQSIRLGGDGVRLETRT
ncbi:MAG: mevalonate kinase [Patescibacteria group bacterium]|nr:mevalonate kinase [Patescibacteria group bacterium]